jgi:hypothetical protein
MNMISMFVWLACDHVSPTRKDDHMSLAVPVALLERAEAGEVDDRDFIECVRRSLPYAWAVVSRVAADARTGSAVFADDSTPPPSESDRGELLRALASDAIRGALQRHFGVVLAFQNCHRVAAFRPGAADGPEHRAFASVRAQLLNQSPRLRSC